VKTSFHSIELWKNSIFHLQHMTVSGISLIYSPDSEDLVCHLQTCTK